MVIFEVAPGIRYYMDGYVSSNLEKKRRLVLKKDRDWFAVVDGDEGGGKSFLAFQIAKFLDPSFDLSRICFTPQEFLEAIQSAHKGQAVVFDEAYSGFSSRGSMTEINRVLNETVLECRKKNLFVLIVLPSLFFLDRTIVLHRARAAFHVYFRREMRGAYCVYTKDQLKILMYKGKQTMNYSVVRPKLRARFTGKFALDVEGESIKELAYEKRKIDIINRKKITKGTARDEMHIKQRDILLQAMMDGGYTRQEVLDLLERFGAPAAEGTISGINRHFREENSSKSVAVKPLVA